MSAAPTRMCVRCDTVTDRPVIVQEIHSDSGPGWNVYACPACAPHYPPPSDPLALLDAARATHRRADHDGEAAR